VLEGLEASLQAGFEVKVNVVALDDLGFDEVMSFCRMADQEGIEVRFIELMPLCGEKWQPERYVPLDALEERLTQALPCEWLGKRGVARVYGFGSGRIGFIRSVTDPFCLECNRLRVAADGTVRPCLLSKKQFSLAPLFGNGACDRDISLIFAEAAAAKPECHTLQRNENIREGSHPLARVIGG
jgi:cyclic pyranopterin phosphate synthase